MINKWDDLKWWNSETYSRLMHRLQEEEYKKVLTPSRINWYRALEETPFECVKAVILGQDPYHTLGMAHGLAFSVLPGEHRRPPSLSNIFKEYRDDLKLPEPSTNNLLQWAHSGVLLWNTVATTVVGQPRSHKGMGWEKLTVEIISKLSEEAPNRIVFLLWGKDAKEYEGLVNTNRHKVITAPHPSPYSAHTGFFGHKPFSRTNEFMKEANQGEISWRL